MTILKAKSRCFTSLGVAMAAGAACLVGAHSALAETLSEPATVLYGKILELNSGDQITEGDLTWVIRRSDGINQILRGRIQPLKNGEYSYSLNVPHGALALGLAASTTSVPLRGVDDTHGHFLISVNGRAALILGPGGPAFSAAQARRTATYRLDLAVPLNGQDSDGNGLPDWWKLRHHVTSATGDPDGDGRNNLAEFANGSDPNHDDRAPSLATRDVRVFSDGTTVVRLKAIDSDSAATNLLYTMAALPEVGAFYLRNATATGNHDQLLQAGDSFSQADVNGGRVLFVHQTTETSFQATSFQVALKDENPTHSASTNSVSVNIYQPGTEVPAGSIPPAPAGKAIRLPNLAGFAATEQPFVAGYILSKEMGYIVGDAAMEVVSADLSTPTSGLTRSAYTSQYVPVYGTERRHVLLGGLGNDRLVGGMEDDVVLGGGGHDSLRGNAGADLFMIASQSDGNDTIEDFNTTDGDAIDLSRVLTGQSRLLTDYLQVTSTSSNTALRINFNGTGGSYTNMVVTLSGAQFTQNDLYALSDNGNLVTGDRVLPARITLTASNPNASENGPAFGEFTLTRSGSAEAALTVSLLISGSAANGLDYQYVPAQVIFAAGQNSVLIPITPYADTITELSEVAELTVQAGNGYGVGSPATAQVTIADLMPRLTIEAIEPRAVKADQNPGVFLISRSGVLDRSVLVRLTIGGTAVNGTDYTRINSFFNLAANQTAGIIEIVPSLTANLQNAKSVQLTVRPDTAYALGDPNSARVMLVQALTSFPQWRAQHFPESTNSLAGFATEDPDSFGIPNLQRYAYNLDARAPDRSRLPKPVLRDGYLTLDLWRRPDATDIDYTLSVSGSPGNWDSSPVSFQEIVPSLSVDPNISTFRAFPAIDNAPQLFFKVRLNYQP